MRTNRNKEQSGPCTEKVLSGIGVAPGIAIGPAYVIDQHVIAVPEYCIMVANIQPEIKRFQAAVGKTTRQLSQLQNRAKALPTEANEEIGLLLEAYKGMVSSSRLVSGVEKMIEGERINAEAAVQRQIALIAAGFAAMQDDYLAARAEDVREVGSRLIRNLLQQTYNPFADAPEGSILLAEEITPADTAMIDPEKVSGFAAVFGGPESHAAIMARALGLPTVLGVAALINGISGGDTIIIDGTAGKIITCPAPETLQRYKAEALRLSREMTKLEVLRDTPAVTLDGEPITVMANLELPRDVDVALQNGAVGVGLLRTEFSFMNRMTLPSEDEQFEVLLDLVQRMDGKTVTVRTLDVGGEKLATALGETIGESINPALGLRAIRLGLLEPKLLDTQLAAILRASAYGSVRVLIPMVSSAKQMRQVRERFVQIDRRLRRCGIKTPDALPPLGAMIEIPGAALSADALSRVCDFFAIGSNDLTQYTLAIDRGDERVAHLFNPFHPSVLRLIEFTIAAAWRANIPVSGCGELAGDPRATALLLGLGLREFSMSPGRLLQVKNQICSIEMPQAVIFAQEVMREAEESAVLELLDRGVQSKGAPTKTTRKKK